MGEGLLGPSSHLMHATKMMHKHFAGRITRPVLQMTLCLNEMTHPPPSRDAPSKERSNGAQLEACCQGVCIQRESTPHWLQTTPVPI